MTPNEKAMIEDLFNRIRSTALPQRDAEAEQAIAAEMARTPGAAYALTQTVLVQDQALRQAADQVKQLQDQARAQPTQDAGSLLSRVGLGGVRPGAVPRAAPPAESEAPPQQPAFGGGAGGGGFLSGALQTAAGVAGGALLFEGVRSLFGGGSGLGSGFGGLGSGLGSGPWGASPTVNETIINEAPNRDERGGRDDNRDDDVRHASYDDSKADDDDDDGNGDWGDDGFDDSDTI